MMGTVLRIHLQCWSINEAGNEYDEAIGERIIAAVVEDASSEIDQSMMDSLMDDAMKKAEAKARAGIRTNKN